MSLKISSSTQQRSLSHEMSKINSCSTWTRTTISSQLAASRISCRLLETWPAVLSWSLPRARKKQENKWFSEGLQTLNCKPWWMDWMDSACLKTNKKQKPLEEVRLTMDSISHAIWEEVARTSTFKCFWTSKRSPTFLQLKQKEQT